MVSTNKPNSSFFHPTNLNADAYDGADLRFLKPSARHQLTLQDHGYGASSSRSVSVYVSALADTHCAYPRRDGQAELRK